MRKITLVLLLIAATVAFAQETVKSKALKLKYTPPAGWNTEEFGGKDTWEDKGNALCHCSGVLFSKSHKEGKLKVLVYPSTVSGLDSMKRNAVGPLQFEDVLKYEKTKNKFFSFEKRRSSFKDKGNKSYDVIRYFAKVEDHFYIIYAWQENLGLLSPQIEKELYEMVNAIEPL